MKNKKRIFAALLASGLLLTVAGCGTGNQSGNASVDLSGDTEPNAMPISKEPITIKYWAQLYGNIKSYNDNEMFKEMEKITGVHVEFVSPPKGQENEQYGVMIASKDLPDIIERRADLIYPGGLERGMEDGFFLDLRGYINKYAPNIKGFMETVPEFKSNMLLSDGSIGGVPELVSEPGTTWQGPVIRRDLLDKIHMDVPRTPDELYVVLKKFKEELNVKYPMVMNVDSRRIPGPGFSTGWGIAGTDMYYGKDGQWHFAPYDENFNNMLNDLQKWYAEGLIDPEFAARDSKTVESAIALGDVGFFAGGYNIKNLNISGQAANPEYLLERIPFLTPKRGEKIFLTSGSRVYETQASIVARTKYPVECIKWLDYMYSPEGSEMCNYGVKGKTYTVEADGTKKYTDFFKNNPDGTPINDMEYLWLRVDAPYYKETRRAILGGIAEDDDNEAEIWNTDVEWLETSPILRFTTAQMDENTTCWQDINTYAPQGITKRIMGMNDADSWETYKQKMKDFGMEKILKNFADASKVTNNIK